jgi:hypothetical protein
MIPWHINHLNKKLCLYYVLHKFHFTFRSLAQDLINLGECMAGCVLADIP